MFLKCMRHCQGMMIRGIRLWIFREVMWLNMRCCYMGQCRDNRKLLILKFFSRMVYILDRRFYTRIRLPLADNANPLTRREKRSFFYFRIFHRITTIPFCKFVTVTKLNTIYSFFTIFWRIRRTDSRKTFQDRYICLR